MLTTATDTPSGNEAVTTGVVVAGMQACGIPSANAIPLS